MILVLKGSISEKARNLESLKSINLFNYRWHDLILFKFLDHLSLFKTICLWSSWPHPATSFWIHCFLLIIPHVSWRFCASTQQRRPEWQEGHQARMDGLCPEGGVRYKSEHSDYAHARTDGGEGSYLSFASCLKDSFSPGFVFAPPNSMPGTQWLSKSECYSGQDHEGHFTF